MTLPLTDPAAIRARGLCPTCFANGVLTIMQPAGKRASVCPISRTEAKRISAAVLASVAVTAKAIDPVIGF